MKKKIKTATDIIANNFWLKIISLIVAIIIWLYANSQIALRQMQ
jgi:YbbR domain-containing protein